MPGCRADTLQGHRAQRHQARKYPGALPQQQNKGYQHPVDEAD